ncbi:hypothetical protein AAFC00_001781 [Neodothiora populina]|uniref:mRNA 3'-end-processing protein n=1 Tax=Neodothiora populina TaxID=2781224 RepID=A0ABR3PQJ4_9PEZI
MAPSATITETILNPSAPNAPSLELSFLPFLKSTYPPYGYPSKVNRPICPAYRAGHCPLGPACPDRHYTPPNERSGIGHLICKHYQRGLCKKGDQCEFAHTFDLRGERECKEFSRWGICPQGEECTYLHIGPTSPLRLAPCPHYARGFCPLGPYCSLRHVKHAALCPFYLAGFCPNGRAGPPDRDNVVACEYGAHPKWSEEKDLKKPEARRVKPEEELRREQEQREEEFFAEEDKRRERFERGETGAGRGWGKRRRGNWKRRGA